LSSKENILSQQFRHRFIPQLETLEERAVPSTVQRPITDFTSQQGTTSVFNTALPGLPDTIGWGTSTKVNNSGNGRFALVDYSGKDAAFLSTNYGINLGTTVSGNVHERPLADGRVEVSVELDTQNALAWASTLNGDVNTTAPLVFGYRAQDVAANPSLKPVLAHSHLQVVFDNTARGAPLPDLVNAFILGNTTAGQELVSVSFRAEARGVVHDPAGQQPDQQGNLVVSQTGVLFRGSNDLGDHDFGYTAEVVNVLTKQKAV